MPSTPSEKTIVIVDDESGIRQLVSIFLRRYHFNVLEAESGKALFQLLEKNSVDLILLDLMLPDIYGIDICKEIRKTSQVPIIMLTAAQGEMNMVLGFEAGADDYMEKPFSVHVLLSRVQAILRRAQTKEHSPKTSSSPTPNIPNEQNNPINNQINNQTSYQTNNKKNITEFKKAYFAAWSYTPETGTLHHSKGRSVSLSKNEAALLNQLLIHNNQAIDREILTSLLHLAIDDPQSRAIDVQISRLRHKLRDRSDLNLIQSIRNKGYALISPVRFER